jgi:hypothetical protein
MVLAAVSLVLVIVNAALVMRNQSIQVEATGRQQVINQGLQFARIRQALAQSLANVAVTKNDREIAELLTRHGVTVNQQAAPAAAAAPQGK